MTKKMFFPLIGLIVMAFLFSMTTTPLLAQEAQEEDIEDFSLEDLLNVEITTAGKKAEKIGDIPASVVLITREQIANYGYSSLLEIMEHVPGLYIVDSMHPFGPTPGVRGFYNFWPANVIFMVNGVKQIDPYHDMSAPQTFNIPVEAIDRIEVVRGPMAVMYGSGAFFGAINVITNEPPGDKPINVVSATYGSEETVRGTVRIAGKKDDFNYSFAAGYYNTAGPDEPLSRMVTNPAGLAGFGVTYDTTKGILEESSKYFNFSGKYKGFYSNFSLSQSKNDVSLVFPGFKDGTEITMETIHAQFGYNHKFSDAFSLDGSFAYHLYKERFDVDWLFDGFWGIQDIAAESYEAELRGFFSPSEKFNLTTGLYFSRTMNGTLVANLPQIGFYLSWYFPDGDTVDIMAGYAQATYSPSKKLKFVGGVRFEKQQPYSFVSTTAFGLPGQFVAEGTYDRDDVDIIPRFAIIYYLNDKNIVKLLYGQAIHRPSIFNTRDQIDAGLPFLNPEEIETFEFNYTGTPSAKFMLNASLYYNKFNNLIVRTQEFDTQGNFIAYNSNDGRMTTFGGELTLSLRPSSKFTAELSGNYQKTKDKRPGFENRDVEFSPNFLAYLKAAYNFDFGTFAVTGRYVDKMVPHWDVVAGGRTGAEVDGYFILDGNFRFTNLFKKGYFLNIRCTNLFGSEYLYPNVGDSGWADKGIIGKGRMFLVTLGKEF